MVRTCHRCLLLKKEDKGNVRIGNKQKPAEPEEMILNFDFLCRQKQIKVISDNMPITRLISLGNLFGLRHFQGLNGKLVLRLL